MFDIAHYTLLLPLLIPIERFSKGKKSEGFVSNETAAECCLTKRFCSALKITKMNEMNLILFTARLYNFNKTFRHSEFSVKTKCRAYFEEYTQFMNMHCNVF